jgi:hypothetical protein
MNNEVVTKLEVVPENPTNKSINISGSGTYITVLN